MGSIMQGQHEFDTLSDLVLRAGGSAGAFWMALTEQNLTALEAMLSEPGNDWLGARDPLSGKSPLEWCVFLHRHDALRALLAWGADPDESGGARLPPLGQAATSHCLECLGALIEAGADPDLEHGPSGRTPLIAAASLPHERHSLKMVSALLAAGADPNHVSSKGYFALGACAIENHAADVLALARADADVDLHAGDGFTALFYAVDNQALAAAEALLRSGADVRLVAERADIKGVPLDWARFKGDADMSGLLYAFEEASALRARLGKTAPGAERVLKKKPAAARL